MRMGQHFSGGEFAHFITNRFHRLIQSRIADRGMCALRLDQRDKTGAAGRRIAILHQRRNRVCAKGALHISAQAQIGKAQNFALIHRNAADNLR